MRSKKKKKEREKKRVNQQASDRVSQRAKKKSDNMQFIRMSESGMGRAREARL